MSDGHNNGLPAGNLRVVLAMTHPESHDQPVLNFGTGEPDVAERARAIIDKRLALINATLRDDELPPLPMP